MIYILLIIFQIGAYAGAVCAQQEDAAAAPKPVSISSEATVEDILQAVDRHSESLKDFSARMRLDSMDALSEETERRFGQIYYEKMPTKRRAAVVFERTVDADGRARERLEHYVYSDGVLSDYDHEAKRLTRRQLVKPGEAYDPLRLGEGPIPIPLGQRRVDIEKSFVVSLAPSPKSSLVKDPASVSGLHLVPRPGTALVEQNKIASIDLWMDRYSGSPVAVSIIERDGDQVSARFMDIRVNTGVDEKAERWFSAPEVDPREWRIEVR